jgi:hypothetical protein
MKITESRYAEYSNTIETTVKNWSETNRDPTFAVTFNARVANDLLTIGDIEMSVGDLGKFIAFLQEVEKAELGRTAGKRVLLVVDGGYVAKSEYSDTFMVQLTTARTEAYVFETDGSEFINLMNLARVAGVEVKVVDV